MITFTCDICGKKVKHLNTMVLYTKTFDYCEKCRKKADNIKKDFEGIMRYEHEKFKNKIKKEENNFIKQNLI